MLAPVNGVGFKGLSTDTGSRGTIGSGGLVGSPLTKQYIRTFNGSTTYGTLNTPINAISGDVVDIEFVSPTVPTVGRTLIEGDITGINRGYIYSSATGKLSWNAAIYSSVLLDGVVATNGVTAFPGDGKIHNVSGTFGTAGILGKIGTAYDAAGSFYLGEILSVKFTDNSGATPVITNYIIDNDSTTITYARGNISPSALYITWSNFTAGDIEQFTYNNSAARWEGKELLTDGSFNTACGAGNWTCDAPEWSISGGVASCNNSSGTYKNIIDNNIGAIVGARYLIGGQIISITGASLRFFCGGTGFTSTFTTPGIYHEVVTCSFDNFQVRGFDGITATVDNVSAKRVIEYV